MKITKATISNFRSIQQLTFDFNHGCQILLGINESGKSNILKALHLVDKSVTVGPQDLRIERSDEAQVASGGVVFEFSYDEDECDEIYNNIAKNFELGSLEKNLVSGPSGDINLREFISLRATTLHEVKLPSGTRKDNYWTLRKGEFKILPDWARNTGSAFEITIDGEQVVIPSKGFYHKSRLSAPVEGAEPFDAEFFNRVIGISTLKIAEIKHPKCIFWRYSDAYLLPSSVDIISFAQNPDSCIPLRSIFELANYKANALSTIIPEAQAHSQHRYISLLRKASEAATKHIRNVWKDHKGIRIELVPNGPILVPLIIDDQVPLDMAARSDGFKRFVSFLLQVSAKVKTTELVNVLLLVDEPEIALHPGGARSLMKELLDIGESNAVVYSTHSIFMVDQENIDRHLIVEKKDEITKAIRAEKSRIQDEEVLYAAMGYSIFETLKRSNVIFEGWRDKEIFRIARDSLGKSDKELKKHMGEIGFTYAEGVKDVKTVARILELANRGCLIISDADAAAIARRKEYEKIGKWGTWVTLTDILGAGAATTGEDLILKDALVKRSNKFRASIPGLAVLADADFPGAQPVLSALKIWLSKAGATGSDLDTQLDALKVALFENLKREELSPRVDELVMFVKNHNF